MELLLNYFIINSLITCNFCSLFYITLINFKKFYSIEIWQEKRKEKVIRQIIIKVLLIMECRREKEKSKTEMN